MSLRDTMKRLFGGDAVEPNAATPDAPQPETDTPDCITLHDPKAIVAGTARKPLGYRCSICGTRCDSDGREL